MEKQQRNEYELTLLDHVPEPILVIGVDLKLQFMNKAARRLSGANGQDVTARYCHQVLHGRDKPCDAYGEGCPTREAIQTGQKATAVRTLFAGTEREGVYEMTATPVITGHGEVSEVVEALRDVSDSHLLAALRGPAEELRQRHAELQALFGQVHQAKLEWEKTMDCVADVVILVDQKNSIKRCNKALTKLAGIPYGVILGRDWRQLFDELEFKETESGTDGFELFHPPSGSTFRSLIYPLSQGKDGLAGSVITLHDVTHRKWMTAKLEEKNQELDHHRHRLQRALDELSLMIRRVTVQGEFGVYFDLPLNLEQCWKVMQCKQNKCPCYGRKPVRCWQIAGTHCGGEMQGGGAQKLGQCEKCTFYQAAVTDPIYRIGEEFNHMMFILEEKNQELANAYDELKNSHAKLLQQEKMASIGQLAAGVAHEINNPVGFVTSNLGTLGKYLSRLTEFVNKQSELCSAMAGAEQGSEMVDLRKALKIDYILADTEALIKESLDGVERVRTIVQNLKSFSRVDQAAEGRADLNQCIEETINIIWNELKYKCEVRKEFGELPLTRCHPQQLNQVFMNLLMNAAQAITEKGIITIRTWAEEDELRVAISDTGNGIPPEQIGKIFEPFYTTKEVGKGTGLGLAITYDIVKRHQGRIEVASEPGQGSTFTVCIPVRE